MERREYDERQIGGVFLILPEDVLEYFAAYGRRAELRFNEHTVQVCRWYWRLRSGDSFDADLEVLEVAPVGKRQKQREVLPVLGAYLAEFNPRCTVDAVAHDEEMVVRRRGFGRNGGRR